METHSFLPVNLSGMQLRVLQAITHFQTVSIKEMDRGTTVDGCSHSVDNNLDFWPAREKETLTKMIHHHRSLFSEWTMRPLILLV